MAQIDFIATWNDSIEILESIADVPDTVFLADQVYESLPTTLISGRELIQNAFSSAQQVFFWSNDIFEGIPNFWQIPDGVNAGKFRLRQVGNETILSYATSAPLTENGILRIFPGMIAWDGRWLDSSDGLKKPLKNSAKKLISSVRGIVSRHMTRITLTEPTWIGREALYLYQSGQASLMDCGKEFSMTNP